MIFSVVPVAMLATSVNVESPAGEIQDNTAGRPTFLPRDDVK